MSYISERVAYLDGLAEGLKLKDDDHGKVLAGIIDVLHEIASDLEERDEVQEDVLDSLDELYDSIDDINEYMEAMDEDLTHVEEELFGELDDEDDCCCDDCCDEDCYEVECPHCGETVCFKEAPEGKTFPCPSCSKEIPLE